MSNNKIDNSSNEAKPKPIIIKPLNSSRTNFSDESTYEKKDVKKKK